VWPSDDMSEEYKRCKRCVMDTLDPGISFDADGNCNFCTEYFVREPGQVFKGNLGQKKLEKFINLIKADGKNKPYDCIMGVSGGVDSTYVAYLAKQQGLRPLAVHFDNGWNSELAVRNIENILNKLNIDLYTHVVDWDEFRDLQLSFLKASVANAEIPSDHGFLATLYDVALKHKIKYFLTGTNFETEGILPAGYGYLSVDLKHILAVHKRFGTKSLSTYPKLSLPKYMYARFVRKLTKVSILNYVNYKKEAAMELIQKELGWQYYGGKHYESIFTRFFQAYILPRKFGFDKRKAHYSSLICSGQMTREEAVQLLKTDPCDPKMLVEDREYVIKKLGLTEASFKEIMNLPTHLSTDYPNNSRIFAMLTKANRWLENARSGKRGELTEASKLVNSKIIESK